MNGAELGMSAVVYRWVLGGICSGFVIYGYLLMGAVNDVRVDVSRLNTRIDQMVSMSQEIRDVDRLEREIGQKADAAYIETLVADLKVRIDQVNKNLGFGKK